MKAGVSQAETAACTVAPEMDFFRRCARQQRGPNEKDTVNSPGALYVAGYYGKAGLESVSQELTGTEAFLASRIEAHLRLPTPLRPVVALDVGGGVGFSWLRLANRFQSRIMNQELVLGVSNIKYHPDDYLYENVGRLPAVWREPIQELYEQVGALVQYITTDLSAINQLRLRLPPNPRREDPAGKVDVVHERLGPTAWSKIPELHVRRLGRLVSPRGIYMVDRHSTAQVCGSVRVGKRGKRVDKSEMAARLRGINDAHEELLQEQGLTRIDTLEVGERPGSRLQYVVFKGRDADPIGSS
jgi:hypothetical protein